MDKRCPGKTYHQGSCFTVDDLISLAEDYNKHHTSTINIKRNKKYLLQQLTRKMKQEYDCDDQTCWVEQKYVNREIKDSVFRPVGPKKQFQWMSTSNIDSVMSQYENKYNDFQFYGAVPYDFEDLEYLPTYKFDVKNILDNINRIGMVINLDTHDKNGSHWVALYINRKIKFTFLIHLLNLQENESPVLLKSFIMK